MFIWIIGIWIILLLDAMTLDVAKEKIANLEKRITALEKKEKP